MNQKFTIAISVIIIAIATALGLKMVQENLQQATSFGLSQDLLTIVGRAQAWYRTPAELGGGKRSFANFSLAAINFDSINVNGVFKLSHRQAKSFRVTATGVVQDSLQITVEIFSDSISAFQLSL